ncbi:MAG: hypothetical protein ACI8P9_000842 [Parasphingorhabdus sp.]|jgi:hypothetical protein
MLIKALHNSSSTCKCWRILSSNRKSGFYRASLTIRVVEFSLTPMFSRNLTIFSSLLILCLPLAGFMGVYGIADTPAENRRTAQFPILESKIVSILAFPKSFDDWWSDHLGFRAPLIDIYTKLINNWLKSPEKVVIGQDNWLYLYKTVIQPDLFSPFSDYCGRAPLSEKELGRWVDTLVHNWQMLEQQGITYWLVVIPNKHTIFAQHFPIRISCTTTSSRYQQVMDKLKQVPGFPIIELTDMLHELAGQTHSWLKYDTHWNARSAAATFQKIIQTTGHASQFDTRRLGAASTTSSTKSGDLVTLSNLEVTPYKDTFLKLPNLHTTKSRLKAPLKIPWVRFQPLVLENTEQPGDTIMTVHDSFFAVHDFQRLVGETFNRSIFIRRPGYFDLEYLRPAFTAEKPNLVIQQFVERKLLLPNPVLRQ